MGIAECMEAIQAYLYLLLLFLHQDVDTKKTVISLVYLCMFVHNACIYMYCMCIWYMCTCGCRYAHLCTHVEFKGQLEVPSSITLCLVPCSRVSSSHLFDSLAARKPQGLPIAAGLIARVVSTPGPMPSFCAGAGIRTPVLRLEQQELLITSSSLQSLDLCCCWWWWFGLVLVQMECSSIDPGQPHTYDTLLLLQTPKHWG